MIEKFVRNAEGAGFHVHRGEPREIADAGSSWAPYGLADTGSSVLAASPEEPRASSLLPAVHVSLLSEDRLLPGLRRGRRRPVERAGDPLSGPSRSADIEQLLAVGVHGPGRSARGAAAAAEPGRGSRLGRER
jgi:Uncharacterized conserved protein